MGDITLDRTDRQILQALQEDGRMPNNELAARVNLSPSPCLRRVRALEEGGVIRRYAAQLDPLKLGLGLLAYVSVKLEHKGRSPASRFAAAVQSWPEVIECHSMTGDLDYLLRVQVADLAHYSRFMMSRLLEHPGVVDVKSSFALETIKPHAALPVQPL